MILLLSLLLDLGSCSACTLRDTAALLCDSHSASEAKVLRKENQRLRSKTETDRIAALEALAASTHEHINAPSARIAKRIASALDDDSYTVRSKATQLLGNPQHAPIAMTALLRALDNSGKEHRRLQKQIARLKKKLNGKGLPKQRERKAAVELKELEERMQDLLGWRAALLGQLSNFEDDRVVKAIRKQEPLFFDTYKVLAKFWHRPALASAADGLKTWEEELGVLEKQIADAEEGRLTLEGLAGPAAPKVMVAFQRGLELHVLAHELRGEEIQERLIATFTKHGHDVPATARENPGALGRWMEKNLGMVPAHLPGVTSPAWAERPAR